jgi:uncharacterized protein (DUF305 family)
MKRTLGLLTLVLMAAFALAACGSDDDGDATGISGSGHNKADVTFATDMIQHHQGALEMVAMTRGRQLDPDLSALADGIEAAQTPEIETMSGWLQKWGEDVPDASMSEDMEGMDMGSDIPGMMSDEEMTALGALPDTDFGDAWLQAMIEHHQGAVQMAKIEESDGENADAVALAKKIRKDQTAEIATMQQMMD